MPTFKCGDLVNATCNGIGVVPAKILCLMPAIEEGDNNIYYKVKPLISPYRQMRPITEKVDILKHKTIRRDNLMYEGCEPHWKCTQCGECVPFHCFTKDQFETHECTGKNL